MPQHHNLLAMDVGGKRVGLAIASPITRLPWPLMALSRSARFFEELDHIIQKEEVGSLVVGLPRGLDGQETAQTKQVRDFTSELKKHFKGPVYLQDEALTSKKAETELRRRGKIYERGEVDALAATYILDDFLTEQRGYFK